MRAARILVLATTLLAPSYPVWAEGQFVDPASVAAARTPEQHRALATRYRAGAEEAKKGIEAYRALAKAYVDPSGPSRPEQAAHCQQLVTEYQEIGAELEAMAVNEEAAAR